MAGRFRKKKIDAKISIFPHIQESMDFFLPNFILKYAKQYYFCGSGISITCSSGLYTEKWKKVIFPRVTGAQIWILSGVVLPLSRGIMRNFVLTQPRFGLSRVLNIEWKNHVQLFYKSLPNIFNQHQSFHHVSRACWFISR